MDSNTIFISPGNKKLGNIASFSLPPKISCGPNQKYCDNKKHKLTCYASRMAKLHPSVMKSWERNLYVIQEDPTEFYFQMTEFLNKYNGKRFRIHVGGDFYDQRYLDIWKIICREFKGTRFAAYTKRNDLDFSDLSSNLLVRYSLAPEQPIELPKGITSKTWIATHNVHRAYRCPEDCSLCDKCWKEGHVFIKIH